MIYRSLCKSCRRTYSMGDAIKKFRPITGVRTWHLILRGPAADRSVCGLKVDGPGRRRVRGGRP
jgi:hypothetical protein